MGSEIDAIRQLANAILGCKSIKEARVSAGKAILKAERKAEQEMQNMYDSLGEV